MKISVFIPCIPEHFTYLDRVIDGCLSGSVLPDEIIVVLSNSKHVSPEYIKVLREKYKSNRGVDFHIFCFDKLLYTGEACQFSRDLCSGDIVVVQAADDMPHRRRIEIVKKYFTSHDIVSLNHSYFGLGIIECYGIDALNKQADIMLSNIKVVQPHEIYQHVEENPLDVYGQFCDFHVAAGTVCYRRQILYDIRWSDKKHGQDTIFCKEVIRKYKKSIIIDAPLYFYYK